MWKQEVAMNLCQPMTSCQSISSIAFVGPNLIPEQNTIEDNRGVKTQSDVTEEQKNVWRKVMCSVASPTNQLLLKGIKLVAIFPSLQAVTVLKDKPWWEFHPQPNASRCLPRSRYKRAMVKRGSKVEWLFVIVSA